jgi:hypothetical protein
MTGLPVATTASNNSYLPPGQSQIAAAAVFAAPVRGSPSARITTSALSGDCNGIGDFIRPVDVP